MYPSTEMLISVQKYKLQSQYKNKCCGTKNLNKNGKKNITTVQQCVSQYRNISFSTKTKVSVQKNIFLKIWKKSVGSFIQDYYYVPKYMLIIAYLNKPYVFHYYKLSRLYSCKHHHTPLYHTTYPFTSPQVHVQHHAPLFLTIYLYTSPYTPIHHHTSMHNTIHPYSSPYTHVSTHI